MVKKRIKILTIVGARPQIIKAAAISRAIRNHFQESITEVILHTGQHYDQNMSEIFFSELGVPTPHYNLNVGSGSHGSQTAKMIEGIENVLLAELPDVVLLFGDTNSTLAGAIAASKLHIPVAHVEAGLRSFNKSMPEEINRIVCDHVSTFLFVPTEAGIKNLKREGIGERLFEWQSEKSHKGSDAEGEARKENNQNFNVRNVRNNFSIDNPGIFLTGDVMYDNSLFFADLADEKAPLEGIVERILNNSSNVNIANFSDQGRFTKQVGETKKKQVGVTKKRWQLTKNHFVLATVHRDINTDNPMRLNVIFKALADIAENIPVIVPLHPRTAKMLKNSLETTLYERVVELRLEIDTFMNGGDGFDDADGFDDGDRFVDKDKLVEADKLNNVDKFDDIDRFVDDNAIGTDKSDHGDVPSCNELIYKYVNKFDSGAFENGTETQAFETQAFDFETLRSGVLLLPPASFFEMITLEKAAKLIITDSGGVQKEAFFFKKPSMILRPETEWVEIVECGAAKLVDADYVKILAGFEEFQNKEIDFPQIFGDGHAAEHTCRSLL